MILPACGCECECACGRRTTRRTLFAAGRGKAAAFAALLAMFGAARAPAQQTDAALRDAIAERWGVERNALRIEYASADDASLPAGAELRLLAGGDDGVWYVDVMTAAGTDRMRVRAGIATLAAVAAHDLERGVVLTEDDIALEPAVAWGPPSRAEEGVQVGWETRRRIRQGEPLEAPAVAAPLVVKPGDDVRIVYARGRVELALAGKAAGSGALGERVAVRAATGKRLEGVIIAPGTVRIETGATRR